MQAENKLAIKSLLNYETLLKKNKTNSLSECKMAKQCNPK